MRKDELESNNTLGQLAFPTYLAFEPVQLCNAACFCCPYTWLRNEKEYRGKKMPREGIIDLLDDFGGIRKRHNYEGDLEISPYRFSDPLICKDLELIFEKAAQYRISTTITSNGVGLKGRNLELLNHYRSNIKKINISLIGATPGEISKMMGIDGHHVISNIFHVAENWPEILARLRVSMRTVKGTNEEAKLLQQGRDNLLRAGIAVKHVKQDWITNRVSVNEFGDRAKQLEKTPAPSQNADYYVDGCGWAEHLLKRMEVMVDGDVVLCCDDAEKHKVFGNVFKDGIEAIWTGKLRSEHQAIIKKEFSAVKKGLICATCSRAEWNIKKTNQPSSVNTSDL